MKAKFVDFHSETVYKGKKDEFKFIAKELRDKFVNKWLNKGWVDGHP